MTSTTETPATTEANALPENLRGDGPCGDCGTPDNIVWHAENVLWNAVMSFPNPPSHGDPGGIICIPCFVKRVQAAGLNPVGWTLTADWPWRWTPEGFETAMAMQEQLLAEPIPSDAADLDRARENVAARKASLFTHPDKRQATAADRLLAAARAPYPPAA